MSTSISHKKHDFRVIQEQMLLNTHLDAGNENTRTPLSDSAAPCPLPGAGVFSPVPLTLTMLASAPGSGNTWTRYLLTTATGLLTGSVYDEPVDVLANDKRSRRVVAVKTHLNPEATKLPFKRAILIVRNPYEALLAEFNRQVLRNGRRSVMKAVRPIEDFRKVWPSYLKNCGSWGRTNMAWAHSTVPLHVIVYHRQVAGLEGELHKVMNFLNESSIQPTVRCASRNREGHAHRKRPDWLTSAAVYSPEHKAKLNADIDAVQKALEGKTGEDFSDFQQWKR